MSSDTGNTQQQLNEQKNEDECLPTIDTATIAATINANNTSTIATPRNVVVGNRSRTSSLGLTLGGGGKRGEEIMIGGVGELSSSSIRLKKSDSFQLQKTESYKLAKKRSREKHQHQNPSGTSTATTPSSSTRPPAQLAYVRDADAAKPMGWDDRFMLSVRRKLGIDDSTAKSVFPPGDDGNDGENSDGSFVTGGNELESNEKKKSSDNRPRHRKKDSMPNIALENDPRLLMQLQNHRRNKSMSAIMIEDSKSNNNKSGNNNDSCIIFKEDEELGHESSNSMQLYQQLQEQHRKKQSLTSIISDNDDNDCSNNIDEVIGHGSSNNVSNRARFSLMKGHRKKQSLASIVVPDAVRDDTSSNNNNKDNISSNNEEEQEIMFAHSSYSSNFDELPIILSTIKSPITVPATTAAQTASIDKNNNQNVDDSRIIETKTSFSSRHNSNSNHTTQNIDNNDSTVTPDFAGIDNSSNGIKSRRLSTRQKQQSPTLRDNIVIQQPRSTLGLVVDKIFQRQTSNSNSNRSMFSKKKNDNDSDSDNNYDNSNRNLRADSIYFSTMIDTNNDRGERRKTTATTTAVVIPNKLNKNDMNAMGPSGVLRRFFHWTFRVYFGILFLLMAICFFFIVIMFALVYMIPFTFEPDCLSIAGKYEYGNATAYFSDAFYLSWTTFSTVGYGAAAVALSNQNESTTNCAFVTIIASLEALSGTLFTGVCGAILFGKVLRILSHAQVVFSDPILIRYGVGAREVNNDDDEDIDTYDEPLPFPVLEFRIINRLNDEDGGEIVDSSVQVVAKVDHEDKVYDNYGISTDSLDGDNNNTKNEDSEQLNHDHNQGEDEMSTNNYDTTLTPKASVVQLGKLWYDKMRSRQKGSASFSQAWHGAATNTAPYDNTTVSNDNNADALDPILQSDRSNHNHNRLAQSLPLNPIYNGSVNNIDSRQASAGSFPLQLSPFKRAIALPSTSFLSGGGTTVESNYRSTKNLLLRSTTTVNSTGKRNATIAVGQQQQQPTTMSHQQYYKIHVEAPEHPFFKRVWIVRHVLDQNSPIVKHRVKSLIKRNNGYWPYKKLKTYKDIIESLQFNHIIVSLNGVSNISASTVYAQKI
jgi:hypothetical protein